MVDLNFLQKIKAQQNTHKPFKMNRLNKNSSQVRVYSTSYFKYFENGNLSNYLVMLLCSNQTFSHYKLSPHQCKAAVHPGSGDTLPLSSGLLFLSILTSFRSFFPSFPIILVYQNQQGQQTFFTDLCVHLNVANGIRTMGRKERSLWLHFRKL